VLDGAQLHAPGDRQLEVADLEAVRLRRRADPRLLIASLASPVVGGLAFLADPPGPCGVGMLGMLALLFSLPMAIVLGLAFLVSGFSRVLELKTPFALHRFRVGGPLGAAAAFAATVTARAAQYRR
jgi:hypothetical protein